MRAPVLVAAEHAVGVAPEHELAVKDGEREGGDGLGEKEGQISQPMKFKSYTRC